METDEIIKAKADLEASIMKQVENFAITARTNYSLTVNVEVRGFFTGDSPDPVLVEIDKRYLSSSIGER